MENDLIIKSKISLLRISVIGIILLSGIGAILYQGSIRIYDPFALFIALIFLILLIMPNKMIFKANEKGFVESKTWMFLFYRKDHREDLSKVKGIIHRKMDESVQDFLLFDDGFEMRIPECDNGSTEIIQWFKRSFGVSLQIIQEDVKAKILPPAK